MQGENGSSSYAKMQPVRCTVREEHAEGVEAVALWLATIREADPSGGIFAESLSPNPFML